MDNLILTLPLAVFVAGGVFLWGQMDRWLREAVERDAEEDDADDDQALAFAPAPLWLVELGERAWTIVTPRGVELDLSAGGWTLADVLAHVETVEALG